MRGLEQRPALYLTPQCRPYFIAISSCFFFILVVLLSAKHCQIYTIPASYEAAENETLGFQKIIALSTGTPWRINGLRAAASHTGLQIEYPMQPRNPPEAVAAFENAAKDATRPPHGSAIAWMAHLDLIKHIIQSGWTTALILEDDVDWEEALREKIMIPMALGVRNYTNALLNDTTTPYGGNWDLLWMGHCGEWSHSDMPFHAWSDETVVPQAEYVGWAGVDMKQRMPEGMRTTHPTTNTVCTFSYGITALGARKILQHVGHGIGEAFDVALSDACKLKKLRCVTIHPEVFHQYVPLSTGGDSSEVRVLNGADAATLSETDMGSTANVKNSARCAALFGTTCQELPPEGQNS